MRIDQVDQNFLTAEANRFNRLVRPSREVLRKRRGSEESRTYSRQFSIEAKEFAEMGVDEFRDKYVREILRWVAHRIRKELDDRQVQFFDFDIPTETPRRRVVEIRSEKLLICLVVREETILKNPQTGATQDEIIVEVRTDVRVEPEDRPTRKERFKRQKAREMRRLNEKPKKKSEKPEKSESEIVR